MALPLAYLRCPLCGGALARAGGAVRCASGHSFDVARQGYVDLTGAGPRASGDSAAMVAAREAFLAAGHFEPIAAAVAEEVARIEVGAGRAVGVEGGRAGRAAGIERGDNTAGVARGVAAGSEEGGVAGTGGTVRTQEGDDDVGGAGKTGRTAGSEGGDHDASGTGEAGGAVGGVSRPAGIAEGGDGWGVSRPAGIAGCGDGWGGVPGAGVGDTGGVGCVIEVGAGTGYYLSRARGERPGIALDSSRYAARRAARAGLGAVVCDVWRELPVRDGVAAVVLCVFAPRNVPEMRRVLSPGGAIVVVTPTPRHLAELVEPLGLVRVDERKSERLAASLGEPRRVREVEAEMRLSRDDVAALIGMGPSAHHVDAERVARPAVATLSVRVAVYR